MGHDMFAEERANLEKDIAVLKRSQADLSQKLDRATQADKQLSKEKINNMQELRHLKGENQQLVTDVKELNALLLQKQQEMEAFDG